MAIHKRGKKAAKADRLDALDISAIVSPFLDRAAAASEVVLQSQDPEGPHQVRVGLRKLRTALSVFARHESALRSLREEARDIAAIVGSLRDLDVVRLEILGPFLKKHPEASGFEGLDEALIAATVQARADVREMLASGRLDVALREARGWLADQVGRPAGKKADKAFRKRFRKAQHYGRRFVALDAEHRHEFRKELKKLRYILDCGAWADGGAARKRFIKRLKALQNTLGAMNDAAAAQNVLTRMAAQAGMAERAAAGQIVACLAARTGPELAKTAGLWAKLEMAAPDWA